MCGRFYIAPEANLEKTMDPARLELFKNIPIKFSGEIFPTNIVPVISEDNNSRLIKPMVWGFPHWQGKGVVFNARQETALEKVMFKDSLQKRKIAVLTSGYYEWAKVTGRSRKDRYIFTLNDEKYLFLAGFWASYNDSSALIPERFTVLTTAANDSVSRYHNRMPVVLTEAEVDDWLRGEDTREYLSREGFELVVEKCDY
jgi:putative SOS response-associated peptidase YedK